MALTKVTGQVIKNTTDVTVGVLTVTNTLAVGGTVSIGGTLTYEDVTNIDSVGLITARNGIVVGSGITLSKDGDVFFTGIATGNGSGLTALNASNLGSGTVPTARLGSGTASSSTFLRGDSTFATVTSTTINNNADNRLITGSGTANTLEAESAITFDGTKILDITSSAGGYFRGTDSDGGVGLLEMGNGDVAIQADTGNAISNSKIHFFVDNTEKLRINSNGQVLINTTALGDGSADDLNIASTGGYTGITLRSDTDQGGALYFSDAESGAAQYDGFIYYSQNLRKMVFGTAQTNAMSIDSNGNIDAVNGNFVVATSGKGINFAATSDASGAINELLDDYEEGTWTPTATNFTITTQYSANYTKIGDLVFVQAYVQAATGSGTGAVSIGGLPYTVRSGSYYAYAPCRIGGTNAQHNMVFQFNNSSTSAIPFVYEGNINEGMISGQHLIFSGFYHVD